MSTFWSERISKLYSEQTLLKRARRQLRQEEVEVNYGEVSDLQVIENDWLARIDHVTFFDEAIGWLGMKLLNKQDYRNSFLS